MENKFGETYKTAEWQRKKNAVLERDDYTCQICGSKSELMQVHHITYKHCKGKAYNAPMGDLITLCEHCHKHDDGDHKSFFDGKYLLVAGSENGKPAVVNLRENKHYDFNWESGSILSMKNEAHPWRSIGFSFDCLRQEVAFFEELMGSVESSISYQITTGYECADDYPDQRLATFDEVVHFIREVRKSFPEIEKCLFHKCDDNGECTWYIDQERYIALKRERNAKANMVQNSEIYLRSKKDPKIMVSATCSKPPRIRIMVNNQPQRRSNG